MTIPSEEYERNIESLRAALAAANARADGVKDALESVMEWIDNCSAVEWNPATSLSLLPINGGRVSGRNWSAQSRGGWQSKGA